MVKDKGYANRSQAVSEMVRDRLVDHLGHSDDREIAGTVTLVYDHHKRNLQKLLTEVQHDHSNLIIATLHIHLDHDNCLEVLALRGKAGLVRKLADRLTTVKGLKHGKFTVTTTGRDMPH